MVLAARLGVLLMTLGALMVVATALLRPATTPAQPGGVNRSTPARSRAAAVGQWVSMLGGLAALAVLAWAFLTEDWRFEYVVGHARSDVAWPLRLAGIWAGPEGSLLLWTTMMAVAVAVCRRYATTSWSAALLAAPTAAYGLALLTVAAPFDRLDAPPGTGTGLQPVLEHPAMVWHPPVLYVGLIALLIPSVLIVGASAARAAVPEAVAWLLPLGLGLLTAGLATGANWAYVELGWGGYWAWDPIENAGLVAWLAGASLLHRFGFGGPAAATAVAGGGRPTMVLAALPAVAAIWATTITRTGVLNSVHAFADRPGLRWFLMTIAVVFTGLMVAAAVRRPVGDDGGRAGATVGADAAGRPATRSRAGVLVALTAGLIVAAGTYEPAVEMLFTDDRFTTSGRFFTVLLWPVTVVGGLLRVRSALSPPSARPADVGPLGQSRMLVVAVIGAVAAMVVVGAAVGWSGLVLAAVGGAVAGTALAERTGARSGIGAVGRLAHVGIGLLMVGVAGTTAATTDTVVVFTDQPAPTPVGLLTHRGVELVDGAGTNTAVATAELVIGADGTADTRANPTVLQPKLVSYVRTGGSSAEVDTRRGLAADIQLVLIDAATDRATYRISRQPRIALVWIGAALTTVGLLHASARGRRRLGTEQNAMLGAERPRG